MKSYPEVLRQLLISRGVTEPEAAARFLEPNYERDLHDPFLLASLSLAVSRLATAIKAGERVAVFADYDADGVSGAAILTQFFRRVGFTNFEVYLPDRHNEAYGLSQAVMRQFAARAATLVITIDCGSSDAAAIALGNELGIATIVLDHHLPPAVLPPALALINPKQAHCAYPEKMLCGSGVVFKLVQGLVSEGGFALPNGWEKWLLDLVAIATIADMVPLIGENRALTFFGLKVLRQTPRPGLLALYRALRLRPAHLSEDDVGYSIAPRLNSASRMSHALRAYELLTTEDEAEAISLVAHLTAKNDDRRRAVAEIMEIMEARLETEPPPLIVAGHDEWLPGVLGLAAARLSEKYRRPVFLWAKNGQGEIKGSCRSDGTVNLVELMAAAGGAKFFSNFGGHALAGGFSLTRKSLPKLTPRLLQALKEVARVAASENAHAVDLKLPLADLSLTFYQLLRRLAPFGVANPRPNVLLENLEVRGVKTFGADQAHLELDLGEKKAIGFFMAATGWPQPRAGERIDLLANLEQSYYRYYPELRLRIVQISNHDGN